MPEKYICLEDRNSKISMNVMTNIHIVQVARPQSVASTEAIAADAIVLLRCKCSTSCGKAV